MLLLEEVRRALPVTSHDRDDLIEDLINEAIADLSALGIIVQIDDSLIQRAVKLYCKMNFTHPDDYDDLLRAYEDLKNRLVMSTGYTTWGRPIDHGCVSAMIAPGRCLDSDDDG